MKTHKTLPYSQDDNPITHNHYMPKLLTAYSNRKRKPL